MLGEEVKFVLHLHALLCAMMNSIEFSVIQIEFRVVVTQPTPLSSNEHADERFNARDVIHLDMLSRDSSWRKKRYSQSGGREAMDFCSSLMSLPRVQAIVHDGWHNTCAQRRRSHRARVGGWSAGRSSKPTTQHNTEATQHSGAIVV